MHAANDLCASQVAKQSGACQQARGDTAKPPSALLADAAQICSFQATQRGCSTVWLATIVSPRSLEYSCTRHCCLPKIPTVQLYLLLLSPRDPLPFWRRPSWLSPAAGRCQPCLQLPPQEPQTWHAGALGCPVRLACHHCWRLLLPCPWTGSPACFSGRLWRWQWLWPGWTHSAGTDWWQQPPAPHVQPAGGMSITVKAQCAVLLLGSHDATVAHMLSHSGSACRGRAISLPELLAAR